MSGIMDSAILAMGGASRRTEIAAINIANVSTPGFKRLRRANDAAVGAPFTDSLQRLSADLSAGKTIETGRPLDLSINGDGYFKLRVGDRILYSRQGGFSLAADGTVVTPQGYVLQQAGGGDLTLPGATAAVSNDGTVMDGGRVVGRIAVYRPSPGTAVSTTDGSLFTIADDAQEVASPSIRAGALESSNVSLGDEMVGTMAAMRDAETGAKLVQLYDDLVGRAIQTFGQTR